MDNGFFGGLFNFDGDGELDAIERTHDFMAFNELMIGAEKSEKKDKVNELKAVGLDYDELWYVDDYERREKIEEVGLDPDDFDF